MEQWMAAALDYAREKHSVGGFLLISAAGYLALRFGAKLAALAGKAIGRYDQLLADWEEMNRRKNDELRAKDLEIRELREQLRRFQDKR